MKNDRFVECWNNETEVKLLRHEETDLSLPVTAVGCYAIKNNSLLMVKNTRGWDVPGGHTEKGETPLDTIKRELKEEANCKAEDFFIIGYLRCRQLAPSAKYPPESLLVIYSCYDFTVDHKAQFLFETSEAKFISIDEIGSYHHNWTALKRELLERAINFKK